MSGLSSTTLYLLEVYAVNAKGRSDAVRMEVRTARKLSEVKFSYSAGESAFNHNGMPSCRGTADFMWRRPTSALFGIRVAKTSLGMLT